MRSLATIAGEIDSTWGKVSYAARPYLDAMYDLDSVQDRYFMDDGTSIVRYFLSNATGWRGDDARRIKAELKAML